jgi:hypothetical protein
MDAPVAQCAQMGRLKNENAPKKGAQQAG